MLYLTGVGFGPTNYNGIGKSLLQGVTYGPSGSEVSVLNYSMVNSSCIAMTVLPGAGSNLFVRVQARGRDREASAPLELDAL